MAAIMSETNTSSLADNDPSSRTTDANVINDNNADTDHRNELTADQAGQQSDQYGGRKPNIDGQTSSRGQRTFVQILYEMFPQRHGVRYVEEGRTGPAHSPLFRIAVHVNGLVFRGVSRTKQAARHEAAREALDYFAGVSQRAAPPLHSRRNYSHDGYHRYAPYYLPYRSQPYDYHPYDYSYPPDVHRRHYSPLRLADGDWRGVEFMGNEWDRHEQRFDYNHEHWMPNRGDYPFRRALPLVFDYRMPPTLADDFRKPEPYRNPEQLENCAPIADPQANSVLSASNTGNDFTSDNYDDENFVEFNDKSSEGKSDEENMAEDAANREQGYDPKIVAKKERIILRVMSETPVHQNPISVIHELHPDAKWHFIGTEEDVRKSNIFKMRLQLPLANQSFTGSGRTKKLAKSSAASKALLQLYNISINPQNPDHPESYVPKSTVHIAQEPLFLNQDLSNKIGKAVMSKCAETWNTLTDIKKWTVLASFVITDETNVDFMDVICITSGTKCVKGDNLSMNGLALNDCHAEVLARRCLLHYLYSQIEQIVQNSYNDKPEFILERREDKYGFRIKKQYNIHLFISTAPCGDSRVFSPKEENENDAHPNRVTRGVLRAKIEGGEGTIPVKRDAVLTWDGILQGHQRLQFMSCSDKIAVWNVVGLQGSLLSHLLEPIYLESVVLGSLFNYEHLIRAIHGRLNLNFDSNSLKGLPDTYHFNRSKVAKCHLNEDLTRQLTKAPSYAINWIKGDETPEVISCDSGRIHGEGSVSRLAKRSLFAKFSSLLGQNAPTLPSCLLLNHIPVIYRDGKTSSHEYQRAKTQVMQTFLEQNLGNWIQVPTEIDLFKL